MTSRPLIISALLDPASLGELNELQWDLLIRQGRRTNLLARLAHRMTADHLIDSIPPKPRQHLLSSLRMVDRQDTAMRWEVECIRQALLDTGVQVILLKGAAYVMAGLPAAHGRTFSDVDILVPRNRLNDVEDQLRIMGWRGMNHSAYDQRYYRQWMHEIPPLRHIGRGTAIDVHHAILPETARIKVNTPALLHNPVPISGHPSLYVLKPVDMLLHSATHLFHEGELGNGLRDLFDLDSLFRDFGEDAKFWKDLVPRATELGLTRPLYYAIRYTSRLLETPIPEQVKQAAEIGKPVSLIAAMMDFCYLRSLQPSHASCDTHGTELARLALYIRSHWIRMPFPLLAIHLTRKAFMHPKLPEAERALDDKDKKE